MQCLVRSRVHAFISRPGLRPDLRPVLRPHLRPVFRPVLRPVLQPPPPRFTYCHRLQVESWPSWASR